MRNFLLIGLVFLFLSDLNAQTSSVKLDSLFLTTRNLFDPNLNTPPSVFDTVSQSKIQVELNVTFYIDNPDALVSVSVRYGATPGANDLFDLNLDYKVIGSIAYLVGNGNQYPIRNGIIFIPYLIPEISMRVPDHIWIRAKDKQGRYSNILTDVN